MAAPGNVANRAQRSENTLAGAIAAYNTALTSGGGHVEFEVRLDTVTAEEFSALRARAADTYGPPVISKTVNVIASEEGSRTKAQQQRIITYVIGGPAKMPPKYSTKTRLIQPAIIQRDGVNCRIGVSREEPSTPFNVLTNALLRYKVRYSYTVVGSTCDWSLDLTIVKRANVSDGETILEEIKREMFSTDSPHPEDAIYEVELELVKITEAGRTGLRVGDISALDAIIGLINPNHKENAVYQRAVHEAAVVVGVPHPNQFLSPKNRLKQLVPQVEAISRVTFNQLGSILGHWATLKYDGERCLVHVAGRTCTVILANTILKFTTEEMTFGNTVVDAEIIGWTSGDSAAAPFTLHVFDIAVLEDDRIGNSDIATRIASLPAACKLINSRLGSAGKAVPKSYIRVEDPKTDITALWQPQTSAVPVDGIIISEPGKSYMSTHHYKWKPTEQNTIDFMIIKCPDSLIGMEPYASKTDKYTYLLFVGIWHDMRTQLGIGLMRGYREIFPDAPGRYYPIQFSPAVDPLAYIWYSDIPDLHGKIGEFSLSGERSCASCEWNFHRIRNDRTAGANYWGNNYKVAEIIYMNYIDDFPLSALWGEGGNVYFRKTASDMYMASNNYKRTVINTLFSNLVTDGSYAFDAAAGRGADLSRYRRIGTKTLLAVDIDSAAIAELVVDRRYTSATRAIAGGGGVYSRFPATIGTAALEKAPLPTTTIYATVMDLSGEPKDMMARVRRYGYIESSVTLFVCNFALHYFCGSEANLRRFLTFAAGLMQPGARAIFTIMNGEYVERELTGRDEWKVTEGDTTKYMFRYLTPDSKKPAKTAQTGKFGRMIEVKLPFTDVLMTEPLCYVDAVIDVAKSVGLRLVETDIFSKFSDDFARNNAVMHKQLTEGDKEYIELHSYIVLEKPAARVGAARPAVATRRIVLGRK